MPYLSSKLEEAVEKAIEEANKKKPQNVEFQIYIRALGNIGDLPLISHHLSPALDDNASLDSMKPFSFIGAPESISFDGTEHSPDLTDVYSQIEYIQKQTNSHFVALYKKFLLVGIWAYGTGTSQKLINFFAGELN